MRKVSCAIHVLPSEQFVGQDRSKLLHDSLTKIFNITDLCFVHHFLHASPFLIIDGIQIWAVRGTQRRIYQVRSFIREKCNRFSNSVRWSTILLENVKLRELSIFW